VTGLSQADEAPRLHPEISPAPLAAPRLRLRPDRSSVALLDGGWWPRSADPATQLPGLILALDEWSGRVTRVMLGADGWNASRPRQIRVDGPAGRRVVRLGWFATMPAGLLTAISANGERTDLVTVPPSTREQDAAAAMDQAVQAGNREHAPAILAGVTAAAGPDAGAEAGDHFPSAQVAFTCPPHAAGWLRGWTSGPIGRIVKISLRISGSCTLGNMRDSTGPEFSYSSHAVKALWPSKGQEPAEIFSLPPRPVAQDRLPKCRFYR
jgi:Family of unknown function (DUF5994)